MSKILRLLTLFVVIAMLVGCLASCELIDSIIGKDPDNSEVNNNEPGNSDNNNENTDNGNEENKDPDGNGQGGEDTKPVTPEFVDYASQVKFDPNSGRANAKVTVRSCIDGDTTHFDNRPTAT